MNRTFGELDEANQVMTNHTAQVQEKHAETIRYMKTLLTTGAMTLARTMQPEYDYFLMEKQK
jgi:hypothetical protein